MLWPQPDAQPVGEPRPSAFSRPSSNRSPCRPWLSSSLAVRRFPPHGARLVRARLKKERQRAGDALPSEAQDAAGAGGS